jgi:hypothetical protein
VTFLTTSGSLLILLSVQWPAALTAQRGIAVTVSGQAIGVVTRADPVPLGGDLTEARIVQPVLMVHAGAWRARVRALGTLNLEGQTIPEGELTPGAWGEGFNDRRHPHTYAHELMLSATDLLGRFDGPVRLSLSAGKGFAPFGSDDPMSRPAVRYPVNHHLAHILERAVVIVGVRAGPAVLEIGVFNGDEPERPGQWPNWDRFGDSWSGRLALIPRPGMELSVSRAKVHSPEHRPGAGTDAWKWHLAARIDRRLAGGRLYALGEWARTEEAFGFFVFRSLLLETAWSRGRHAPYYRFERSDRPEDVRTTDPFRSLRPHLENAIVGTTRWTVHTLGHAVNLTTSSRLDLRPFVELSFGTMRNIDDGIFQPRLFYGKGSFSTVSVGLRAGWRIAGHRMGRYGGLLEEASVQGDVHHHSGK